MVKIAKHSNNHNFISVQDITVFDPVVCKIRDAPSQNELLCRTLLITGENN